MPKLIIDGREIEVPQGTKVIEAAARLGIMIPRFCYHPALGPQGACRLCAVKFLEGPVKGVEMSCMTRAQDGMVVSTTDPEAMEFRRYVIEWLMLHHPHDCPVCDEGGHCLLQDETVSGGHGLRRYLGKKRTFYDQDLGPFVQHEMNRCIHCWRCRNFYQDFAGYRDLGALQIGNRMYFGRYKPGRLESPFAGNLIDICPTGVFTDKPSRYKGRHWDYERGPSLCLHCSLGCSIIGSARYREMIRLEARFHEAVNGYFICDRGRYGFAYAHHPERPRQARVDGREASLAEGLRVAAARLADVEQKYGPAAVAGLGSPRTSLEAMAQLTRVSRLRGWAPPYFFPDQGLAAKVKAAVSGLDESIAASLRELEAADFIVVAGADPINEAPMLALALRQARRRGGTVAVIDPRPIFLPLEFHHLAAPPAAINQLLQVLVKKGLASTDWPGQPEETVRAFYEALPGSLTAAFSEHQETLFHLASKLGQSRFPVLVCGLGIVRETTPSLAAALAQLCRRARGRAGMFFVLPGPNAFGAGLLSRLAAPRTPGIWEQIAQGAIKALILVECDPFWDFPDRAELARLLDKLEQLVVCDCLPSPAVTRADLVLPTVTLFEAAPVSFVNQEGRLQRAAPIFAGGTPISQVSGGGHPPRVFLDHLPGGDPRRAADLLADLAAALPGGGKEPFSDNLWVWLAREAPAFRSLAEGPPAPDNLRLLAEDSSNLFASLAPPGREEPVPPDHLELLLVDWTFGTEELAAYSPISEPAQEAPYLALHAATAARLGLKAGDPVELSLPKGTLTLPLKTFVNMSPEVMVLPRHRQLNWQQGLTANAWIPVKNLQRG